MFNYEFILIIPGGMSAFSPQPSQTPLHSISNATYTLKTGDMVTFNNVNYDVMYVLPDINTTNKINIMLITH